MLPEQLGNSANLPTSPEYHDTSDEINEDQFGDDFLFDTEKSTMDKMADMGFYLVAGSIVIILCYGIWTLHSLLNFDISIICNFLIQFNFTV